MVPQNSNQEQQGSVVLHVQYRNAFLNVRKPFSYLMML